MLQDKQRERLGMRLRGRESLGKGALVLCSFPGLVLQFQSHPCLPDPTGILMHHYLCGSTALSEGDAVWEPEQDFKLTKFCVSVVSHVGRQQRLVQCF